MVDVTQNVIRLGNFSDGIANIDPDGVGGAENSGALLGQTYTSATMSVQSVTYTDGNNDGFVNFDGSVAPGGDYVTYDTGNGPVSESVNQGVWYNVDIVLGDGSTLSTSALIFQTPSGETFLTEFANSLDNLNIQSITPTAVNNDLFARFDTYESINNTTVCFGPGTEILTPEGPRPVEDLRPGDLVSTLDGAVQPVVAIYRMSALATGAGAPIRFDAGALGDGMPEKTLYLSGNHRVLCESLLVERMFQEPRVLVAAKRLVGLAGVRTETTAPRVDYTHLELAEHSVLWANGALVESCLLGPMTLQALPGMLRRGIAAGQTALPCHPIPSGRRQREFVERLMRNGHPVVDASFRPRGQVAASASAAARHRPMAQAGTG